MKLRLLLASMVIAGTMLAQPEPSRSLSCDDSRRDNGDRQQVCEMIESPGAVTSRVLVDGRVNGGVSVKGWQRSEMLVRARKQAWAPTEAEARTIVSQIVVRTAGGDIRADAPDFGRDRGWSVSYEIFVPVQTDLSIKAHNGGISISDVRGTVDFEGLNGGVNLKRLAGRVRGRTVNGGLNIELEGTRWEGDELDVSATNGGVRLLVPEDYSARLETRTVNGRISIDFPVTMQGKLDRQVITTLGSGGALIRAVTTNGGVSVKKKS